MDDELIEGLGFDITATNSKALSSLDAVIDKLKKVKSLAKEGNASGMNSISKALTKINEISAAGLNRITKLVTALSGLKGIGVPTGLADSIRDIANATKDINDHDIKRIDDLAKAMNGFSALRGVSGSAIRAASRSVNKEKPGYDNLVLGDTQAGLTNISESAQMATASLEEFDKARERAFSQYFGGPQEYSGTFLPAVQNGTQVLDITDEVLGRYRELQRASTIDPFVTMKSSLMDLSEMMDGVNRKKEFLAGKNYGQEHAIPLPQSMEDQRRVEFLQQENALLPSVAQGYAAVAAQRRMLAGVNYGEDFAIPLPPDMEQERRLQFFSREASILPPLVEQYRDLSRAMKEVADASNSVTKEPVSEKIKPDESSISAWSRIKNEVAGFGSALKGNIAEFTKAYGPAIMAAMHFGRKVINIFKKVLSAFKTLVKTMASGAASIGKGVFNYLTGPLQSVMGALSNLSHQVGRVLLFRVLRTMIKDLGTALSEGIQNLYQWSLAVDQSFSNAMNTVSTAGNYIKNSVAAMVAPLIESLAPALDFIADKIVMVFNLINQLFALLGGKSYWTKATKQTTEFAKAASSGLGSAGGAASGLKKELDLVLASFDELHLLAKENASGGGGGGGGGGGSGAGVDYSTMFENVPFDQTLKDLIDKGDWFGVGSLFADKLNAITEAADKWIVNTFQPWAIKWATRLGDLINGFVANYRWAILGRTVADGMMAIVRAANAFLTTTDFLAIGKSLAIAVNSWFNNMDWTEVATMFANKMNAAINVAKGFVLQTMSGESGTTFGTRLAAAVTTWFTNVDWNGVAIVLETGINWAIDAFCAFVESEQMWSKVKDAFDSIFAAVEKIDFAKAGRAFGNALIHIIELIDWKLVGQKLGEFFGAIDWNTVLDKAWEAFKTTLDAFLEKADIGRNIISWFSPHAGLKYEEDDYWSMIFKKIKGDTDKGLEEVKDTTEKKTRQIRDLTKTNLTEGYNDASARIPSVVDNVTRTANAAIDSSGAANIGAQTKGPIKENLLTGFKDAEAALPGTARSFKGAAGVAIGSNGLPKIGEETKTPIKNNLLGGFNDASKESNKTVSDLVKNLSGSIKSNKLSNVADNAASNIQKSVLHSFDYTSSLQTKISNFIWNIRNSLSGVLNNVNLGTPKANMPTYSPSTTPGGHVSFKRAYVTTMATGGVMDTGELYLAREAGAELVGRVGSSSAVMNNDQIVEAVSAGVAQAVAGVMGGTTGGNTTIVLEGNMEKFFRAIVKENNNVVARTGNSPLMI